MQESEQNWEVRDRSLAVLRSFGQGNFYIQLKRFEMTLNREFDSSSVMPEFVFEFETPFATNSTVPFFAEGVAHLFGRQIFCQAMEVQEQRESEPHLYGFGVYCIRLVFSSIVRWEWDINGDEIRFKVRRVTQEVGLTLMHTSESVRLPNGTRRNISMGETAVNVENFLSIVDRKQAAKLAISESCRNCCYFVAGLPNLCNAFHNMSDRDVLAATSCNDWEQA